MNNSYCPDISSDRIISEEIIEPEEGNDIKTVIIIYRNEKNQIVKRTQTFRVTKKMVKVLKSVLERNKWKKFGQARNEDNSCLTTFGNEVELSMEPKKKNIEELTSKISKKCNIQTDILLNDNETKSILFKDRYKLDKFKKIKSTRDEKYSEFTIPADDLSKKKYIPPSQRTGYKSSNTFQNTYSLCVSNIPNDITKDDFYQLGCSYGNIAKVFLPKDKYTGEGRGFGFIHYYKEEHMNLAIKSIDKQPYQYQILSANIAKDIEKK